MTFFPLCTLFCLALLLLNRGSCVIFWCAHYLDILYFCIVYGILSCWLYHQCESEVKEFPLLNRFLLVAKINNNNNKKNSKWIICWLCVYPLHSGFFFFFLTDIILFLLCNSTRCHIVSSDLNWQNSSTHSSLNYNLGIF